MLLWKANVIVIQNKTFSYCKDILIIKIGIIFSLDKSKIVIVQDNLGEWKRCIVNEELKIYLVVNTPIILPFGRLRQDASKFESGMGYIVNQSQH